MDSKNKPKRKLDKDGYLIGIPKRDGSGRGKRLNQNRGECDGPKWFENWSRNKNRSRRYRRRLIDR